MEKGEKRKRGMEREKKRGRERERRESDREMEVTMVEGKTPEKMKIQAKRQSKALHE